MAPTSPLVGRLPNTDPYFYPANKGRTNFGYPSIAVNKFRDVLVGYSFFPTNGYASAGYSFHACNDPAGSMQSPFRFKNGTQPYWKEDARGRNRWGDYSATVVDPGNDVDLWTIQEFATNYVGTLTNKSGRWSTWWGKVAPPLPANDHFTNSFLLSGSEVTTNGTTVRATQEASEPNHGGNANSPSVWYSWTAPAGGSVTFDATNGGANFNLTLAVYTGSSVSALTLRTNATGFGPKVVFTAVSNTTYRIAVAGFNGSCGDFALHFLQATPPAFVLRPLSTNVVANVNENVILDSLAIGIPDPTYQWKFYGTNTLATTNNIANATNASYTITNAQTNHAGNYFVVASNATGTATSAVASAFVHMDSAARLNLFGYNSTSFWFQIYGLTNRPYRVESATNLSPPVTWTPVFTNTVSYFYTNFTMTNNVMRFYRSITNN